LNILLTGATGFIGQALVLELLQQGFFLTIVLRKKSNLFTNNINQIIVGDLNNDIDWSSILNKIDCIIHLAGKAHVIDKAKASA
jgi:nucleoside-diphosphate-sugar epimerase